MLETLEGHYLEPTHAWIEAVMLCRYENENGDLKKILERDSEARERVRAEREQKEDEAETQEFNDMADRIMANDVNRVYSFAAER